MFWERVASPECKTEQKWIWHSYIMSNQNAEAKGMIEFQTFPLLFLQGKAGGGSILISEPADIFFLER